MSNRYFICSRYNAPVEIDVAEDRPVKDAEIAYFIRGFRILETTHEFDGYTVCFAWGSNTKLPVLGDRVISVVYGDEHCRVPPYVNSVHAVMKPHGFFPPYIPRSRPLRLAQIEAAEFVRNLALWMPAGWRWALSNQTRRRCHLLTLGYGVRHDVAPVPFQQRQYLTSFLGSIAPAPRNHFLRRLVGTPKAYSRQRLVDIFPELVRRYGEDRVKLSLTAGFQDSLLQEQFYKNVMAQTQICVAPRGTAPESWRISDGLQAGCIVIADRLPNFPYYKNSPIIQIEDWRDLPDLIANLISDKIRLQSLHEESLRYWRDVLAEPVLAQRYAGALSLPEQQV